tara:strand:+ start:3022 stop:4050 length:1029 start_codon:yes stop_codon:yes gene_type:complete
MKKKLIYILPTNFQHEGIKIKVEGQTKHFNTIFNTKLIQLNYNKNHFILLNILKTITFEINSILHLICYKHFFIRYNPKSFLVNINIVLLSFFKKITIEHNLIMTNELKAMNRYIELIIHNLTLNILKLSKAQHLCVNTEIKNMLISKGFNQKYICYHQNGYTQPKQKEVTLNKDLVSNIKELKKNYSKIAIFIGSGRPWHGLDKIISLFNNKINCGIIIIGPYEPINSKQFFYIPYANSSTIEKLITYSDFGISNFNWKLININVGSPLKSRQYLCNGLPILTNYKDSAEDYKILKPYIFNIQENSNAISDILNHSFKKEKIKNLAIKELSWKNVYKSLKL